MKKLVFMFMGLFALPMVSCNTTSTENNDAVVIEEGSVVTDSVCGVDSTVVVTDTVEVA